VGLGAWSKEEVDLEHHDDDDTEAAAVVHPVYVQAHPLSSYKAPVDVLVLAADSRPSREFMNYLCD
jgi:hypothetical protein